jgi:hypothetical protein
MLRWSNEGENTVKNSRGSELFQLDDDEANADADADANADANPQLIAGMESLGCIHSIFHFKLPSVISIYNAKHHFQYILTTIPSLPVTEGRMQRQYNA